MKILQINSVCGIGSTGRIATDIHKILIEQGHESYIAYGRDISKYCDTMIKIGSEFDNYTHVILTRLFDKHGFGSKRSTQEFIKKIESLNPDVIHLHNIHGYYINVEILFNYLKKIDKPVIWTLHDCWSFTGHCAYFDFAGCSKWKNGCYNCPETASYPRSVLMDNSKNNYLKKKEIFTGVKNLTVVTPSKWLAGLVSESYLSEYPIKVINNGIDIDVFKPTQSDFRKKYNIDSKFIILGVASIWDRRKGLKYLIELSEKLKDDEVIVLVGLSEKQKRLLPKNIVGITRTNNLNELIEIYTSADVFVNPTLEDNFPTTNLESLACGTPVLTFDTGGSLESIDELCGSVINPKNTDGLRDGINKCREYPFNNGNCIERSNKLYDKNERCNDYIDLYLEVLI